ncbi:manganese catalase family protein [Salmonella enterica subsp. enterica]|nr:manganese catalase family protein [Salmonella enterica subsp. enterica]
MKPPKINNKQGGNMFLTSQNNFSIYRKGVSEPNPGLANLLLNSLAARSGELAAACRYFTQGLSDDAGRREMLMDIATEELSHLEIIGSLVECLIKALKASFGGAHRKRSGTLSLADAEWCTTAAPPLLYGGGPALTNSGGVP